ncbi:hypothetical protein IL306_012038 [Fusarium sp. DS 682]|nr:hypothetical protein IL306_012038 [Fusarium sp. DS 682]
MAFQSSHEKTSAVEHLSNTHYFSYPDPDFIHHQDLNGRIDPLLQHTTPYSGKQGTYHGTNSMQRYLQEPQSSYFTAPSNIALSNTQYTGIYPDMGSPLHHSSQVRHGSPMSYQQSSAASGPQSPHWADNDAHIDSTQGPSTPSDIAVLSPNIAYSGSLSPSVSLYGLSNISQGCVNPAVIEPNQNFPGAKGEEELGVFTVDMNADFDSATPNSFQGDGLSSASTSNTPPSELYSQSHNEASYPDPDSMDVDAKVKDEAETTDNDGDDEYRPKSRAKPCRNVKRGSRSIRTRRLSSTNNTSRGKVTKSRPVSHAGACGYSSTPSKGALGTPTHCRVFKRKDLYTQHIRRMHAPEEVAKAGEKEKSIPPDWLVQEKKLQEEAFRQRCRLPTYMRCPAKDCTTVFSNGNKTWDDRMEHVAIHLERAAKNEEPQVVFGDTNDEALTAWASQRSVRVIVPTSEGWETCQPLKGAKIELSRLTSVHDEGLDEDAEGEEC